jgi:hypothetical protein
MGDSDPPALDEPRALLARIAALEGATLEPEKRAAFIESLEGRIEAALDGLEALFAGHSQPLEAQALDALNLSRHLAMEASEAARRAAIALPGAPAALGLAMRLAARAVRDSFAAYARVPRGAWQAMHGLYGEAQSRGAAPEVQTAYAKCLLLSITDPYRLESGELARIEALLRKLGVGPTIGAQPTGVPTGRHFAIEPEQDHGPVPLRRDLQRQGAGRVLDTTPVIDALRAQANDATAARLLRSWESPPKRVFQRQPAEGSVAICAGVKPIAHFVAHDADVDGEAQTHALRHGMTMPLRALPEDEGGRMIPIHEWALINLSAGGLRVRRRAATAHPITVGEVVGIRAPGKAAWTVGVTRWITADEDGATEFGVQYFAQAVCAVWVRALAGSEPRKLGLLVAEGEGVESESLLVPPQTYSSAGTFDLRGEGFRSRVKRGTLVEANARFELFRIQPD